jgi:DNA polymerase I-like protein with 3'-5' exonuclease and polymerase domains
MGVFAAPGWERPANLIDLYVEFTNTVNGYLPQGEGIRSLTGALRFYRLRHAIDDAEKDRLQELAQSGPPPLPKEHELMTYNEQDARALADLYSAMRGWIAEDQALLRGRYATEVAWIEDRSTPIDVPTFERLQDRWQEVLLELIRRADKGCGVYEGTHFRMKNFFEWVDRNGLLHEWPRTPSGQLSTAQEVFDAMAERCPEIRALAGLQELRSQMKALGIVVGPDGRNRVPLRPFWAETGRCQSKGGFIFIAPSWLRGLIKAVWGTAIAYVDFQRQEPGIAAALSRDPAMLEDYRRGDPYIAFAERIGAITQTTGPNERARARELCKTVSLAVNYGMGARSLALRLGRSIGEARQLLDLHRRTYSKFWRWVDDTVSAARTYHELHTCFGFMRYVNAEARDNELMNWPMQSTAGEILRVATMYIANAGIAIASSLHDALLIESPADEIDDAVETAKRLMSDAAEGVLSDVLRLGVDAKIVRYPRRYLDPRGVKTWKTVMGIVR